MGVTCASMASRSSSKFVAALDVAVGQRHAAVELDLALVDRVARVGVEHLVAGVHEGEDELADHRLAAGLDGDVLRAEVEVPCEAPTSAASASRSGGMPALGQ